MRKLKLLAAATLAFCIGAPVVQAVEFVELEVDKRSKRYFVDSQVIIAACPASVFHVLTDYDDNAFTRVSKIFVESRFLERDELGNGLVYTKAEGCIAFFCTELERVEQLNVVPITHIEAIAIRDRSDSAFSHARWVLEPEGESTRLNYSMEFEPGFWVPPLLGSAVIFYQLKKQARLAAEQVELLAVEMKCPDPAPAAAQSTASP